jgi:hypothetical protein
MVQIRLSVMKLEGNIYTQFHLYTLKKTPVTLNLEKRNISGIYERRPRKITTSVRIASSGR